MAIQLLDLPQLCLEEIFKGLSYSEISRLGSVCRYFREIAKTIFRLYFRRQEELIEKEMEKIEMEASKAEKLTVDEHLYLALLHSILRILLSEAKMLKAHCWRYMRDPSCDFCFPAGRILDEFEKILRGVREKTLSKDMEPEISTTLFHLGEKFYDYFDTKIETYFRETSETKEKTLFGVKLLDILDCCATSDFHSLLYYDNAKEGFLINTEYKLTDVNVLQALPSTGLSFSNVQRQLNKICCYVRNNVRWTNLFHPLQDLWMLEDAIEINRNVHTASALLRQWKLQRTSSRITLDNSNKSIPKYNYKRVISRFKNCFGLVVLASLECPTTENMPLKLQKYIDLYSRKSAKHRIQNKVNNAEDRALLRKITPNNWNENLIAYKFHLELKIQYPSFLTDKIQEAILKVDQKGEETVITSNSDKVKKSATFRADEGSNDE